ncbi:hypothetical protein Cdeb_01142 [Caldibacillus debilis GB1]|uniref:Uncharacterized protein n=2 Tax=Caldibacillus debilis TaxID=301148 RepID=A0A420VDF5_9BACI|nr:hypothetical protein Cdeb_01142 [Caldibacillus debilis GB1]
MLIFVKMLSITSDKIQGCIKMSFYCDLVYNTGSDEFKQITINCSHEGMLIKEIGRLLDHKVYYMAIRHDGRTILSLRKENKNDVIIPKFREWLDKRQEHQIYELIQKFNQLDIGYNLNHEGIGFLSREEEERALRIAKEMNLEHLLKPDEEVY